MKGIAAWLLGAGLLGSAFAGRSDPPAEPPAAAELAVLAPAERFRVRLDKARNAVRAGDFEPAEAAYVELLAIPVERSAKGPALLELGTLLEEKRKRPVKAAAVYEQFLSLFPEGPDAADLNLRLGRIYRTLGSRKVALNKFYNVLYAALRLKNGPDYQRLVFKAQCEIAHTHFEAGEYSQAAQLYARLRRTEMAEADRIDVDFRHAYLLFLARDYATALPAAREFLAEHPGAVHAAECQYLVIQTLKALGRNDDAVRETLALLRSGERQAREHPEVWAHWQRKTGNDIANELYEKGDTLRALSVYQTLAEISADPEWRWPAVYQIALCFERLKYPERALEAYRFLLDAPAPKAAPAPKGQITGGAANLEMIREMAGWRADHLRWMQKTEGEFVSLLGRSASADQPRPELPERAKPESAAAPR